MLIYGTCVHCIRIFVGLCECALRVCVWSICAFMELQLIAPADS